MTYELTSFPRSLSPQFSGTIFLAAVALTAWAVNLLYPAIPYSLGRQLQHLEERGSQYNIVAIGSSFTVRNLDPMRLDASLRSEGIDARTFVLGVENFGGHAIHRLILRGLNLLGKNTMALILIETRILSPRPPNEEFVPDLREIWWHDVEGTIEVLGHVWISDHSKGEKMRLAAYHLRALLLHYLPVGRAILLMADSNDPKYDLAVRSLQGHLPFRVEGPQVGKHLRRFQQNPSLWTEWIEAHRARLAGLVDLTPYPVALIEEQVQALRERSQPIYINFPVPMIDGAVGRHLYSSGHIPYLLDFSEPDRSETEKLWRIEFHFDHTHLNDRGTAIFTQALAVELIRLAGADPRIERRLIDFPPAAIPPE